MDPVNDVRVRIDCVRLPRGARVTADALGRAVERELDALLRLAPPPAGPAASSERHVALDAATVRIHGTATPGAIARQLALQVHRQLGGPR